MSVSSYMEKDGFDVGKLCRSWGLNIMLAKGLKEGKLCCVLR